MKTFARWGMVSGVVLCSLFAGIRLVGPAPAGGVPAPEAGDYLRGVPGPVTALLLSREEGIAYAGTGWGVYRSADGGRTWERVFRAGVWQGPVQALAADTEEQAIYAAAGEGIYRRRRGEEAWRRVYAGRGEVLCAAVSPDDPGVVLAGSARGLLLSRDGGDHWGKSSRGIEEAPVRQVLFDPVRRGICYALSGAGLYRSGDAGESWALLRVERKVEEEEAEEGSGSEEGALGPSSARRLTVDAKGDLYLGTGRGILLSENAGESWRAVPSGGIGTPSVDHLLCDPVRPGVLYAATSGGLFAYSGEWEAWRPVRQGTAGGEVGSIGLDSRSGRLWIGTRKGMYLLSVGGEGTLGPPPPASGGIPTVLVGPPILAVQQAAIRYAEVQPEKISRWRTQARWRSFFPRFTVGLDRDLDPTVVSSTTAGVTRFSVGPEQKSVSLGLGFSWELGDLIWNPDQTSIDVRSRLMVQLRQDVLDEVTRLYFERKRLLSEFARHPSDDPLLDSERSLRVEEVTAQLDALTGGWFSENN